MVFAAVRGILRAMAASRLPGGPPPDHEEDDLVRKSRDGDRRAFDRLVALHLPQVWATVWRVLRHREDTEDVVQEVFVTAHRSLSGFRGDAKLSTWLHRIAVTRALNHRERAEEKRRRASEPIDPEAGGAAVVAIGTPLTALESKELMRRLADCLEKLPAAWRAVLALRESAGSSYERIAEILHVELGTVRSRLARARAALRDCVEGRAA
jgi:RNA polymerase sigma-70 factor (ECF subfamily)